MVRRPQSHARKMSMCEIEGRAPFVGKKVGLGALDRRFLAARRADPVELTSTYDEPVREIR
jgi:hypothetical protein